MDKIKSLLTLVFAKARKATIGGVVAAGGLVLGLLQKGEPIDWRVVVAAFVVGFNAVFWPGNQTSE